MPTHRITSITLGVPNLETAETFYTDFGLTPLGDHRFGTVDGGEQLQLAYTPVRRLIEYGMGVDDPDDISRAASRLSRLDISHKANANELEVLDPGTGG